MLEFKECHSQGSIICTRYLDNAVEQPSAVVVLLHDGAWGASAEASWGRMFNVVPSDLRVIAPDLLGFGGSDKVVFLDRSPYEFRAQVVLELIERLGISQKVHLVGNSFGGSVALRALTDPAMAGRIQSVTSISGTGGPWRSAFGLSSLATFDGTSADFRRIMDAVTDPFEGYEQYVAQRFAAAATPGHYQCMIAPHAKPPEGLRNERSADPYPANLAGVYVPLHLIVGSRDVLVEQDWPERLAAVYDGETRITRMDTSHSPNLSEPEQTWALMEVFIREMTAQSDPRPL
jgi:pimeloyl-ACP methyl ester carboxylesterase